MVPAILVPCRPLSVHEHYSLELMNKYGVTVPKGSVAFSPREAKEIAIKLGELFQLLYNVMFIMAIRLHK